MPTLMAIPAAMVSSMKMSFPDISTMTFLPGTGTIGIITIMPTIAPFSNTDMPLSLSAAGLIVPGSSVHVLVTAMVAMQVEATPAVG